MWRSRERNHTRSVPELLLDFVFGEARPQSEMVKSNDEHAWPKWLNSMENQETVIEFEDTIPTSYGELHEKQPTAGMSKGTTARRILK